MKDPLKTLHTLCQRTLRRETSRYYQLASGDILQTWTPDHLEQCLQQIEQCIQSRRQLAGTPTLAHPYTCHCGLPFETTVGLQTHLSKKHHDTPGQLRSFNPASDLQAGLPTCRRCNSHFTSWWALKHHVEYRCSLPLPRETATANMELQSQFSSFLDALHELAVATTLCTTFQRYCSICLQFHGTIHSLRLHWKTYHPTEYSQMPIHYHILAQHLSFQRPCQYCTSDTHHVTNPQCNVLQNVAMLRSTKSLDVQPPTSEQAPYQCLQCNQKFKSKHGREQHYIAQHGQGPTFDVMRDQQGTFQCSHCSASFKLSSALRRHIEQGSCPNFDAAREYNIEDGLDPRILQSVRDLLPSNILEDLTVPLLPFR